MGCEFDGAVYGKPREMREARRRKYLGLVSGGTSFTQAAKSVGVSKRTGKVWGNGRARSTGRDGRALVDWHRGGGMARLPELMLSSLTWDQGGALARHRKAGAALGMRACFLNPRSPWRRGTNENANGLPRQHFPRGTDSGACPEGHLDAVAGEPDGRPRKTPGLMKPSELFAKLIDESEDAA